MRKNLTVSGGELLLNGEKIQILSGAVHYFRVVPEYWEDRLIKLKNCGLNTVETYVPWNIHEPYEGEFCFDGMYDLERFLKTADSLGLYVILRPSPYICAEWEFGGLPYWLLKYDGIELRCSNLLYLEKVKNYYDILMPLIKKQLWCSGGPVIALQIENEYGSYGNDREYVKSMHRLMLSYGLDTFFFTSDGTEDYMLNGGPCDGVFAAANFGSDSEGNFARLEKRRPGEPHFCMEYWCGWFEHWGEELNPRSAEDALAPVKAMLEKGEHFNIYMFYGGTNFGFMNGANYKNGIQPTVTSYDYGAPLTENGEYTELYGLLQNEISKHRKTELMPVKTKALRSYGKIEFTESAYLFDNLEKLCTPIENSVPLSFEKLDQPYGFVLYRTKILANTTADHLYIQEIKDRVCVYSDGKLLGIKDRLNIRDDEIWLGGNAEDVTLELLVENLGRINYGPMLKDKKGMETPVAVGNQFQFGYMMYPIDFSRISELRYSTVSKADSPLFLRGEFYAEECADTFLDLSGFTKGCVFVNGFNLGRYWNIGPELDLYLPGPLLKKGRNDIVIFEIEGTDRSYITANDYRIKKENVK